MMLKFFPGLTLALRERTEIRPVSTNTMFSCNLFTDLCMGHPRNGFNLIVLENFDLSFCNFDLRGVKIVSA